MVQKNSELNAHVVFRGMMCTHIYHHTIILFAAVEIISKTTRWFTCRRCPLDNLIHTSPYARLRLYTNGLGVHLDNSGLSQTPTRSKSTSHQPFFFFLVFCWCYHPPSPQNLAFPEFQLHPERATPHGGQDRPQRRCLRPYGMRKGRKT